MEKITESVKNLTHSGTEKDVAVVEEGRISSTDKKENAWISNLFTRSVEARGLSLLLQNRPLSTVHRYIPRSLGQKSQSAV